MFHVFEKSSFRRTNTINWFYLTYCFGVGSTGWRFSANIRFYKTTVPISFSNAAIFFLPIFSFIIYAHCFGLMTRCSYQVNGSGNVSSNGRGEHKLGADYSFETIKVICLKKRSKKMVKLQEHLVINSVFKWLLYLEKKKVIILSRDRLWTVVAI